MDELHRCLADYIYRKRLMKSGKRLKKFKTGDFISIQL